jgi:hypothetical protein
MDVTALGSLLKFGLPGLVLGLVLGIIPGVLSNKISEVQHRTLATCFKYATVLFGFVCLVNGITLYLNYLSETKNSRMTVAINVQPSFGKDFPNAVPRISTDLTPTTVDNRVDVSTRGTNSVVKVDISDMRMLLDRFDRENAEKTAEISAMRATGEERAKLYAAIIQTPIGVHEAINKVLAAQDGSAVAEETCRESNHVLCGWAHLANGNISAAQASFNAAATDTSVPHDQVVSAKVGLGYTLLTEGKTSDALKLTKEAAMTGDEGATKQLKAISSQTAASNVKL